MTQAQVKRRRKKARIDPRYASQKAGDINLRAAKLKAKIAAEQARQGRGKK